MRRKAKAELNAAEGPQSAGCLDLRSQMQDGREAVIRRARKNRSEFGGSRPSLQARDDQAPSTKPDIHTSTSHYRLRTDELATFETFAASSKMAAICEERTSAGGMTPPAVCLEESHIDPRLRNRD